MKPLVRKNPLVHETPEQREAIFNGIRMFGQPLHTARWLQTDSVIDIRVPDGFRGIVYPDAHSPYEHANVLRAIWDFAEDWGPHLAFGIGDELDFSRWGRHTPNAKDGTPSPNRELESARRQLRGKMRAGKPRLYIVTPGNHDERERQQLAEGGAAFADVLNGRNHNMLSDLATNLLGFDHTDPIMFAWGAGQKGGREGGVTIGDIRLRHGNLVSPRPGSSAYAHWLKSLMNTWIGHVHRTADFYLLDRSGKVKRGGELGCNINARAPGFNYISSDQDWSHAFGVLTTHNGITHMQIVPFLYGEDEAGNLVEYFTWVGLNGEVIAYAAEDR